MEKDQLQELVDNEYIAFGARLTVSIDFVIPKGYTSYTPEELFKEWFEKFPLNLRTHGHAFRDGSLIASSEKDMSYEIIKKTK